MVVPSDKPIPEMYSDPDYLRYQEVQTHILTGIYDKPVLHRVQHSGHKQITEWFNTQPDVEWIVDIGCGDGAHYEYIEKRESVIGIERDIESLQKIREKYPQPMLIQIEHCSTAKKVVDALKKEFTLVKHRLFPFNFLPFIAYNLILTMQLTEKACT